NGSATFNKNILGLTAGGMNTLNVSDTQGLLISQIYETYTPPTALTIKNDITSAYGLYIGGNGRDFWSESLTALTINNTCTQTALFGNIKSNSLTSLTLKSNVN